MEVRMTSNQWCIIYEILSSALVWIFEANLLFFPYLSLDEKNFTVEIFVLVCRLSILYIQMIERVYSTNELKSACECVNIEHRTCSVLRHIIQWNNSHAERKCRKTCRAEERMSIPVRCWNWMCAMRHTFTILPNMERTSFHSCHWAPREWVQLFFWTFWHSIIPIYLCLLIDNAKILIKKYRHFFGDAIADSIFGRQCQCNYSKDAEYGWEMELSSTVNHPIWIYRTRETEQNNIVGHDGVKNM